MIGNDEQARKLFRKIKFENFMWGFSWAVVMFSVLCMAVGNEYLGLIALVLSGSAAVYFNPYKGMVAVYYDGKMRIILKGERPHG